MNAAPWMKSVTAAVGGAPSPGAFTRRYPATARSPATAAPRRKRRIAPFTTASVYMKRKRLSARPVIPTTTVATATSRVICAYAIRTRLHLARSAAASAADAA